MSRGFGGAMLRALGAGEHSVTVVDVVDVVPGFRRVQFVSDTIFDDFTPGPGDYVRLWFPDLDDPEREVQRGYTVLHPEPEAGRFAIDFVLHEPKGPASTWASGCQPGDALPATVYGSTAFTVASPEPAGFLLIGDAASIPAINSMIEAIPDHLPIELVLEWGDEHEVAIPIATHPRLAVQRLRRDLTGAPVVEALAGRDWGGWYAWVGSERATVKAVKTALKERFGFPKSDHKAQAYWIHGKSFGTSRGGTAKTAAAKSAAEAAKSAPDTAASAAGQSAADVAAGAAAEVSGALRPAASPAAAAPEPTRWRSQAGVELLRPLRPTLRIAALIQAVLTLAGLVPFVLLVEVGRRLLDGQPVDDQWPLARLALVLLGASTLVASALMLWLHLVDARFALALRRRIVAKLAHLPLGWFTERNSGTLKQAVVDDTARLHYYVTHAAADVVAAVVAPLAVLVYLFAVDARLAAVLLVPVIAYVVVFASMMAASGAKVAEVAEWSRRMNGESVGYLDGLPVVRMFGGPGASRFRRTVDEYVTFLGDWQRPFVVKKAVAALLTDAMTFLTIIVVVGGLMVTTDHLSPGDLLPFLVLGTTFGSRLLALAYNAAGLREARAAAQRIGVTLTEPELDTVEAAAGQGPPAGRDLRFDAVTFGYRRGEPVLHGIDLTIPAGAVTALVGPSGSGKSTLAALAARFHDPDEGTVRIGGVDLRSLAPDVLYTQIGFVLQDDRLLRASLRDNIALARPDASLDETLAAARSAMLGDVIDRLPHGLDTVIGDEALLSGGEVQRVAIARAILADTPIVVLDEATAFADPDSEFQVQSALSALLRGRTVLVIAHRLHTIVDADQIVVLDGGRIVERGAHRDLLAAGGLYHDLWSHAEAVA